MVLSQHRQEFMMDRGPFIVARTSLCEIVLSCCRTR
jgi:hypothetical protein